MKTSAVIPNSVAVCQGNTGNLGSTTGSLTNMPDALPMTYNVDLVNISGYQSKPKQEYPDKSYILSISEDSGVKIGHGSKTVVFSQAIQPVGDSAYFQMTAEQDQFGRIRYPKMIVYRRNSTGRRDSLLTAYDGNTYQLPVNQIVQINGKRLSLPERCCSHSGRSSFMCLIYMRGRY